MEIREVPLQVPTEEAPKRRGRPPKLDPITGERVNKPGASRSGGRKPRSLETQIGAMLTTVNVVIQLSPLSSDALDMAEIMALAKAMDAQAQQSPRFRKYVERMLAVSGGGQLIGVVAMILARRASRHGLAPANVDGMLGALLAGNTDAIGAMSVPGSDEPDSVTGETAPQPLPFDYESTISQ